LLANIQRTIEIQIYQRLEYSIRSSAIAAVVPELMPASSVIN